jgi:pyridoxal phosphate phosphatase PHOSPHO2
LSQKSSYSYERMVYVGDSKNDVCPSLSLKSTDLVLARKGRSMEAILKQDEFQSRLKAKLVIWNDGSDVYDIVKGVLLS